MDAPPRLLKPLAVILVLVAGVLPPLAYWQYVGRAPTVAAAQARAALSDPAAGAVLVDVRPPAAFAASHVAGAVNWPCDQIATAASPDAVPQALRGKRLLLICESGVLSARAALMLQAFGVTDVASVRGGMQLWVAATPQADLACCLVSGAGTTLVPGAGCYRESSPFAQWTAVLTGFVIKPFYMFLALGIAIFLWRSRRPELVALRWGLLFFFLGELACAVNYLSFHDDSFLTEFLHSYGMVLCFAFTTWAVFEGADRWLIRYSDAAKTCAALPLCRECIKHNLGVPCGLRRMFYMMIPAAIIMAFMPLTAPFQTDSYNTEILGTFYNYSHPVIYQVYEIRLLPVAAIALMVVSLGALIFMAGDAVAWSKFFFAAGMGALGFSMLRLFILAPYHDNQVWFTSWEELTELLFVVGVAVVLWLFRRGLFAPAPPDGEAAPLNV
jgi:rhodanese-related sulfurtransferase